MNNDSDYCFITEDNFTNQLCYVINTLINQMIEFTTGIDQFSLSSSFFTDMIMDSKNTIILYDSDIKLESSLLNFYKFDNDDIISNQKFSTKRLVNINSFNNFLRDDENNKLLNLLISIFTNYREVISDKYITQDKKVEIKDKLLNIPIVKLKDDITDCYFWNVKSSLYLTFGKAFSWFY
jgi:hypothetical protein